MKTLFPVLFLMLVFGCTKQNDLKVNSSEKDNAGIIPNLVYLSKIIKTLKDSLSDKDYSTIDFTQLYKSRDANSNSYFVRIGMRNMKIVNDFILLRTDNLGNLAKGKIVHVSNSGFTNSQMSIGNYKFLVSSLNRKNVGLITNTPSNEYIMNDVFGEQTLPGVVVVGYIFPGYTSVSYFSPDYLLGGSISPGATYTYIVQRDPDGDSVKPVRPDPVKNISNEATTKPAIDVQKYIKCFSTLPAANSVFKISILTDIPVNDGPDVLFDFHTGDCGHTFIQLTKTNGNTTIQQNIGFYPYTGWKSIEANAPVASKFVDNAGHEFNASLTVSVDATHFQTALNEIQHNSASKYDIDNFNCTDFALNVFNSAAPLLLDIPQYHIPGGMYGEVSNTPQGLYIELFNLNKTGGYSGGQITIPGVAGYTGSSHGPCN